MHPSFSSGLTRAWGSRLQTQRGGGQAPSLPLSLLSLRGAVGEQGRHPAEPVTLPSGSQFPACSEGPTEPLACLLRSLGGPGEFTQGKPFRRVLRSPAPGLPCRATSQGPPLPTPQFPAFSVSPKSITKVVWAPSGPRVPWSWSSTRHPTGAPTGPAAAPAWLLPGPRRHPWTIGVNRRKHASALGRPCSQGHPGDLDGRVPGTNGHPQLHAANWLVGAAAARCRAGRHKRQTLVSPAPRSGVAGGSRVGPPGPLSGQWHVDAAFSPLRVSGS